jgi:N-acetylglucosaminyldiphosphoundecaprenol N-acetyl-beta-D-mannosaminyltransferase
MNMPIAQIQVLGCPLAATTYAGAVTRVREMAAGGAVHLVEAANTMVVTMARHERDFREVIGRFDLCLPDGMPLIWAMNRQLPDDEQMEDRVYGPTLMLRCFEGTQDDLAAGHFLLGGQESTLEKLVTNFGEIAPGAKIMGTYSPPFGEWPEGEDDRICKQIRESGAKLIWVGLGCPKQEIWMARMRERLPDGVYFGIGAAFAFHAGEVSQAPSFMQKRGMEWLYRLCMEPRRLFTRYFKFNSLFLFYSLKDRVCGAPRS